MAGRNQDLGRRHRTQGAVLVADHGGPIIVQRPAFLEGFEMAGDLLREQAGDEATQVQVTVSETCSAVAYNSQELTATATELLTTQALKKLGSG